MLDSAHDPESAPGSDVGRDAGVRARPSWLGLFVVPLVVASALLTSGPLPALQRSVDDAVGFSTMSTLRSAATGSAGGVAAGSPGERSAMRCWNAWNTVGS